jgi:hypothetical protein
MQHLIFISGVAKYLRIFVKDKVLKECFESILKDMLDLESDESDEHKKWLEMAWNSYVGSEFGNWGGKVYGKHALMPNIDIDELKKEGSFDGVSLLSFWKDISDPATKNNKSQIYGFLRNIAAMLSACPAGESIDETVFTSTGQSLTKLKNSWSPLHLEQITVIRMFIRNFGWSFQDFKIFLADVVKKVNQYIHYILSVISLSLQL